MANLKKYKQKRQFNLTPEPKGEIKTMHGKPIFVIQKHDASHLHYDFRLQEEDVLVSWAVPKGLSTAANEKRLAVRTEDHPLDYADFEGVIPKGEYGAGTVLVWDKGTYELISDAKDSKSSLKSGLKQGSFKINLQGEKLQGGYALVKMDNDSDDEQWLIFKLEDKYADARRNPVSTEPDSVLTNRSLKTIRDEENDE